jgi:hypothetical protein
VVGGGNCADDVVDEALKSSLLVGVKVALKRVETTGAVRAQAALAEPLGELGAVSEGGAVHELAAIGTPSASKVTDPSGVAVVPGSSSLTVAESSTIPVPTTDCALMAVAVPSADTAKGVALDVLAVKAVPLSE